MTSGGGRLLHRAASLILAAALAFAPLRLAHGEAPSAQADELLKRGVKLRAENKIEEALDLFRQAQALGPSSKALAQIGSAEAALERWVDAEEHLADALARHDSSWIDAPKNREMLERLLAKARDQVARIRIEGEPGAAIEVNRRPVGTLPLPSFIRVPRGRVEITGTAPGRKPARKEIFVLGGDALTTQLSFDPIQPPTIAAQPRTAPPKPDVAAAPPPPKASGSSWKRWTGAIALVGAAAAITVGVYWWRIDGKDACDHPPGQVCPYIYDTKNLGIAALVGGTLVAAGGVWLILSGRSDRSGGVVVGPRSLAFVTTF